MSEVPLYLVCGVLVGARIEKHLDPPHTHKTEKRVLPQNPRHLVRFRTGPRTGLPLAQRKA